MNQFESYLAQLREEEQELGPVAIKELSEQGHKIVGTYCLFTPYELIAASGAVPVSLCSMNDATIKDAEKHLPRNLCPLIKSSYGYAVTDRCPYFHFADLIVGETTCDGKKKMYEYLEELKPMHVMQLPQSNSRPEDFTAWKREMVILQERLEKEFGVKITEEQLSKEIKRKNKERQAVKDFYSLAKLDPAPVYGTEILDVLNLTFGFNHQLKIERLTELTAKAKESYQNEGSRMSSTTPRILLTGSPIGEATSKIVKLIEESGGNVVCFENCTGTKGREVLVDEGKPPLEALTEKYLKIACSCISPNDNRLDLLSRLIDQYQVDGVIDMVLRACHTYNVETFKIKDFVNNEKGIPYTSLETNYSQSDIEQLRTRISAFIEML
ncbi:MAG: double-cubane-cluster-containing anaerobic reductase [Bacillota bacterium]